MWKRRTGKLRTPTKRRPSETPPIFSIRIGHTLVDMLGPRHSMAEPPFFGDRQSTKKEVSERYNATFHFDDYKRNGSGDRTFHFKDEIRKVAGQNAKSRGIISSLQSAKKWSKWCQ